MALFLTACGHDLNTAQGVAEEFVDHHYVKIDLQKAKQFTVSVAQAFLFEGKIQSNDGTSFTRKWSIATRKENNGWRVSNFTESE